MGFPIDLGNPMTPQNFIVVLLCQVADQIQGNPLTSHPTDRP